MSLSTEDISKGLRVAGMIPLDAKTQAATLAELSDLGTSSEKAFTYYDGLRVLCLENRTTYEWKEVGFGEVGLIPSNYVYPPGSTVGDKDYSGKLYNFVPVSSAKDLLDVFYYEPSVNIEYGDGTEPAEALHFGTLDIGSGDETVALISESFASQSGFDILHAEHIGAEIKLSNASNGHYLGQFKLTSQTYNGFRVMEIVEAGNYTPISKYETQGVLIHVLHPARYSFELSGSSVILKKGTHSLGSADLSPLLTGGDRSISGISDPDANGIVTFTMSDNTTYQVDFSSLTGTESKVAKQSNKAPSGGAVYENIFVTKAVNASVGKGFYAADLTTNYNQSNFAGFPYPAARDYVVCKYNNFYYLLVRKDMDGARIFRSPNGVYGLSFYYYNNNTDKSMKLLSYLKVLARKAPLVNLDEDWDAYPVIYEVGDDMPKSNGGEPNETFLRQLNEAEAYPLISKIYQEDLPLRKDVDGNYTLKEEDHGRILFVGSGGTITVPALSVGFECGFIQNTAADVLFAAGTGVTLRKPAQKQLKIEGQYYSVYLVPNTQMNYYTGYDGDQTNDFVLVGDLAQAQVM